MPLLHLISKEKLRKDFLEDKINGFFMKIDEKVPIKAICAYPLYNRQMKKNHLFPIILTRVVGNNGMYIIIIKTVA